MNESQHIYTAWIKVRFFCLDKNKIVEISGIWNKEFICSCAFRFWVSFDTNFQTHMKIHYLVLARFSIRIIIFLIFLRRWRSIKKSKQLWPLIKASNHMQTSIKTSNQLRSPQTFICHLVSRLVLVVWKSMLSDLVIHST